MWITIQFNRASPVLWNRSLLWTRQWGPTKGSGTYPHLCLSLTKPRSQQNPPPLEYNSFFMNYSAPNGRMVAFLPLTYKYQSLSRVIVLCYPVHSSVAYYSKYQHMSGYKNWVGDICQLSPFFQYAVKNTFFYRVTCLESWYLLHKWHLLPRAKSLKRRHLKHFYNCDKRKKRLQTVESQST